MSIFSLFHQRGDLSSQELADIGVTMKQAKRLGLPSVGDSLMLEVVPGDLSSMPSRYYANVKVSTSRHLILDDLRTIPSSSNNPILTRLEPIQISFMRGDTLYRVFGHPFPMGRNWAIARPASVTKIERRGAYRIMLEMPTTFRFDGERFDMNRQARISNLSAGGMLLVTNTEVNPMQRIIVMTPVGQGNTGVELAADVLETRLEIGAEKNRYYVRTRFVSEGSQAISNEERELIIHYIFEEQRLMLKARKLTANG